MVFFVHCFCVCDYKLRKSAGSFMVRKGGGYERTRYERTRGGSLLMMCYINKLKKKT